MLFNLLFLFCFIDVKTGYLPLDPPNDTLYAEASVDINRVHTIDLHDNNPRDNFQRHHYTSRNNSPIKYKSINSPRVSTKRASKETSTNLLQPREDPRLFYQSDSYLQETNVNYEVASVYPGGHNVNANKHTNLNPKSLRLTNRKEGQSRDSMCVMCPHDRTLVAKAGSDRVLFLKPRLAGCSGEKDLRNIRFELIYGPPFGSLLAKGSHVVVGRIYDEDKPLQLCKMQVHVITQSCHVPSYLIKHCDDRDEQKNQCRFSCRNPKWELHGPNSLTCENNRRWSGKLPVCKVRTSCESPLPPTHGWISCKGSKMADGTVFQEGSKCRVKCSKGWRRSSHLAICRRGTWTKNLTCI